MTNKKEQIVTPKGIVGPYPAIDRVDYGTNQYPDKEGSYKCEIRLDKNDPDVKALLERFDDMVPEIEKEAEAFKKKMLKTKSQKVDITVNPLYRTVFDEEGNETDLVALKAKTKASGVNKQTGKPWSRKLPIRDSKNNLISANLGISTGSLVKMAFTLGDIYVNPKAGAGRAFYLDSVMLLDLVQYGGDNPFGAEEEESGYTFDPSDALEETQEVSNDLEEYVFDEDEDDIPDFAS